jgi:hypothetical protein
LGVVPCPTLAALVGSALLGGGFEAGAWRLLSCFAALFYSLVGILHLGVWLDFVLLIGAVGLMAQHLQDRGRQARNDAALHAPGVAAATRLTSARTTAER